MKNVIIMGAAGRDFHNFNVFFRENPNYRVVAFTAAQIPGIASRRYPPELAGRFYPKGIPISPEEKLPELVRKYLVDEVVLSYSDLPHTEVMHKASLVLSKGADFVLLGPRSTMLRSKKPVIAVTAVRTGCGKSETTRRVCGIIRRHGLRPVVVRHPMPYGDLLKQAVQRFASYRDLDMQECTIEEREEYEPLIEKGIVVYAGVDYAKILEAAEKEADVIVWDGGNNDFPFFAPDLHIVLTDPLRPGHEISYHPGETNLRMADIVIINKERSAKKSDIEKVRKNIRRCNPKAKIVDADSAITASRPELIKGKRVLVIEDGPTLTHGGMPFGAGTIAAKRYGGKIVDARKYAVDKSVFKEYPHLKKILPAMGYSPEQLAGLEGTIKRAKCDAVVSGTPIDLRRILRVNKPIVRIRYELKENKLGKTIGRFLAATLKGS